MLKTKPRSRFDEGQAMVEFAMMLIIFMALCLGMLYASRLLSIDYWAQQEARFVAFEQTWAPRSYYGGYSPAFEKFADGQSLHRPRLINRVDRSESGSDEGGLPELLSYKEGNPAQSSNTEERVLLAGALSDRSIWHDRATDWLARNAEVFDPVQNAFATEAVNRLGVERLERPERPRPETVRTAYQESVSNGFQQIFHLTGFGGRYCRKASALAASHGADAVARQFSRTECARVINSGFSDHLARTLDFREIYREMNFQLESGFQASDAVQISFEKAVAHAFYSFFDQTIKDAFQSGDDALDAAAMDADAVLSSDNYTILKSEMRYIGSADAVSSIGSALNSVSDNAESGSGNAAEQQAFEDGFNNILHAKADDTDYLLPLGWLPIPPTLKPVSGSMFNAVMNNVLTKDADLRSELVEDSNRAVLVTYQSAKAFSQPFKRRWNVARNLNARFYLVTEPWHITRRVSATGAYRDLGDENDSMDDDTEEGILRRRVSGLYLFPSRMFEMLAPFTDLIPGFDAATPVLSGADDLISGVKDFVLDNPLQDFAYFLQELPLLSAIDFTFPQWPAVRPQAYPGTTEIQGDKLTIFDRNFRDYIQEQKDNNPPAEPEYHDE